MLRAFQRQWVLVASVLWLFSMTACRGTRPQNLGAPGGQLQACPDKPNCVSSQSKTEQHAIAAFPYQGPESFEKLAEIALAQERTSLVKREGQYLWIEYESRMFRFVDDLELIAAPESGQIHVRSASRLGHSDLGVNRQRVEQLRSLFQQTSVP